MLALSAALVAFGPKAAVALDAPRRAPVCYAPWLMQLAAGCTSLAAVARLASKAGVQSSTAFRIAAAHTAHVRRDTS